MAQQSIEELRAEVERLRRLDEIESRLQTIQKEKTVIPEIEKKEEEEPGFFASFGRGVKKGTTEDIPRQATILGRLASGNAAGQAPIPVSPSEEFKVMHPSTWSRKSLGEFLGRGLSSSLPTIAGTGGGATAGAAIGTIVAPGIGTLIGGGLGAALGAGATGGAQTLADFYNDARIAGASHEEAIEAAKDAGFESAAINAVLAPLGGVGLKSTIVNPGLKSTLGYAGKQAGIQGAGSAADIANQNRIAQESGIMPDREISEGVPEAFFAGAGFQGLPIAAAAPKLFKGALTPSDMPVHERISPEEVRATPEAPTELPSILHELPEALPEPEVALEPIREAPAATEPEAPVDVEMVGKKIYGDRVEAEKESIMGKVKSQIYDWTERPKLKAESAIFNFQAPIRELGKAAYGYVTDRENLPYRAARFAKHMTGIVENALSNAVPFWNKAEARADFIPGTKGLMDILTPALGNKDLFQTYMYARRVKSQELATKGKEKNISQAEANATVNQLEGQYPEFKEIFSELQDYKKSVLDMGQDAGLLNAEERAVWEDMDHVPFYRTEQLEKKNGKLLGTKNKLTGQVSPIKALTGGSEKFAVFDNGEYKGRYDTKEEAANVAGETGQIHTVGPETADMFENLALNVTDLIERSVRNGSVLPTIEAGKKVGIIEPVKVEGEKPKDVIQVMEDGKKSYYKVADPLLYNALTHTLNPKQQGLPFLNGLEWAKNMVSRSIMSVPNTLFRVAVKDQLQSLVMGRDPGMTLKEAVKHFSSPSNWYTSRAFKHEFGKTPDPQIQKMMSMGADVNFFRNEPKEFTKNLLKRANEEVKPYNASYLSYALDTPKNIFRIIDKVGRALELSVRLREAEKAKRNGASEAEAAYSAMDYMDYAMRGDNPIVQLFGQTIPFLNAHLAGLHKVGREVMDNKFRNRTVKIGASVAGLSMINMINNLRPDDNEEDAANNYMSLPNYIRNDNICVDLYKIPGMDKDAVIKSGLDRWLLIPKPWEIGALFSTIPEMFVQAAMGEKNWKESLSALTDVAAGTLSFNPVGNPLVKTITEQWANKKFFAERPVVPRSREGLEPELQYGPQTSETAKLAGEATGISPDRIQHAATGLLGPAYLWPIAVTDYIIDKAKGKAAKKRSEYPILSTFTKSEPQQSSYQEEFYEMYREVEKAAKSLKQFHELGMEEKAEAYEQKNEGLLGIKKDVRKIKKELKEIDDEIQEVQSSEELSPKDKRKNIDDLTKTKNSLLYDFKQMKKANEKSR